MSNKNEEILVSILTLQPRKLQLKNIPQFQKCLIVKPYYSSRDQIQSYILYRILS
jgi:hypothetical protein